MKNLLLLIAFCLVLDVAFATPRDYVNVTRIKDAFEISFVHNTAAKDYVIGVRVSSLNVQKAYHDIELEHNENWSDLCLDVLLKNPLPELLVEFLPAKFLDVRVFYRVTPKEDEDVMCPLIAMICPDGTTVGYTVVNGQCTMVCPDDSYPTGGLSWDQVEEIRKTFTDAYLKTVPYSDYLSEVGLSTLALMNKTHNITLGENENWTDYCLSGLFRTEPNEDVFFPLVYQGARVFYSTGDDFCLQLTVGCDEWWPSNNRWKSIVFPVVFLLFVIILIVGCRIRYLRRRCACKSSVLRAPEEPVTTPLVAPSEYPIEMFPPQYEVPYDPQELEQPILFNHGYPAPLAPVFVPQHGWFLPVPVPPQRQQE